MLAAPYLAIAMESLLTVFGAIFTYMAGTLGSPQSRYIGWFPTS